MIFISERTESPSSSSKQAGLVVQGTPPPVLPPKTRKLPGVTGGAAEGQQVVRGLAGSEQSNNTKRHQQLPAGSVQLGSVVRVGALNRSASSVGSSTARLGNKVSKPVRRSKSQLPARGNKFVTSITHGGSVTLVSLNDQEDPESREFQPIDPDITPR